MGATQRKLERAQSVPKLATTVRPATTHKFSLAAAELNAIEAKRRGLIELHNSRTSIETLLETSSDSLHMSSINFPSGNKISKTSRHTAKQATSIKLLSLHSRELIKDSWKVVQRWSTLTGNSVGIFIFERIFHECPQLRPVFHVAEDETLDLIDEMHPFLRHAKVFTNMIDLTVRNIDELEIQIAPALITYGRRHFYKHHVGFNPMYMNVFAESIVKVIEEVLGDQCNEQISAAWHQLTQYMVLKLKQGYDFEGLNRKKTSLFT